MGFSLFCPSSCNVFLLEIFWRRITRCGNRSADTIRSAWLGPVAFKKRRIAVRLSISRWSRGVSLGNRMSIESKEQWRLWRSFLNHRTRHFHGFAAHHLLMGNFAAVIGFQQKSTRKQSSNSEDASCLQPNKKSSWLRAEQAQRHAIRET